jgi:hypothetical protein
MNTVELLRELDQHDARLIAEGDQLSLDAPEGELSPELVDELRQQREILREVLWRAEAMRGQMTARGPVPLLVARGGSARPRHCVSCGDPVPPENPGRCRLCVTAAVWVLQSHRLSRRTGASEER